MTKRYQAPIVKKAFEILKAVAQSNDGLRLSDISTRLNISKSTVHGIAAALKEQGVMVRDPRSKRYTIGLTLMELGKTAYERVDIKKTARPVMENLMAQCRESVFLGVRNGHHVTVIDIVDSPKAFKISSPIGTTLPLLAGAVGKVFLAAMPGPETKAYLKDHPLKRFTPRSITDAKTYLEEIVQVRKQGYAFDDQEYIDGVSAVAAPLKPRGSVQAAIWVVGFTTGMGDIQMPEIIRKTLAAAHEINDSVA